MRTILTIFLIVFTILCGQGQNYYKQFIRLNEQKAKDSDIIELLEKWEKAEPNCAELYVSYFNYYFNKSKKEIVHLERKPGSGENIPFQDSTGKTVGYIYAGFQYNDSLFQLGQKYVNIGLQKNPKRLDMYFGKLYTLRVAGFYDKFTEELKKVIDIAVKTNFDWLWSEDKKLEDSKNFFKETIQQYCNELFSMQPPLFDVIIEISNKMISHFPNDIEYYSNIGSCYAMQGKFKKGIDFFEKAIKINTKDIIVLNNLAYSFEQIKDYPNAIRYYKMVGEYGNNQDKVFADKKIKELSNK